MPPRCCAPTSRVTGDVVRIGDVIDNAGTSAQIAIYRAPDLGTTGSLPTAQVIAALQAHQVIGVDTRDIKAISVTRLARTVDGKEIEGQVARALEHRSGLGDAANLSLTFDRDVGDLRLEASNTGALQPTSVRYEPRSGRFDVSFEIGNESQPAPVKLRFTGSAIETVEAAVLTRARRAQRSPEILRRRHRAAAQGRSRRRRRHAAQRAVGMQMRTGHSRRPGPQGRRSRQARPGAARRERHPDLRDRRGFI